MKKFSDIRKIKMIGNPINKNKDSIHPITLELASNTKDIEIIPTQFFLNGNNFDYYKVHQNEKLARSSTKNMETPELSLPLTDILNIYDIDTYEELIQTIKKMLYDEKPIYTIYRLVNIYTRVFYDTLKKTNNSLLKIFKLIFDDYKINDDSANKFLINWFKKHDKDDFEFNISKDFKNFLSN
jgi:hypothetical protein